MDHQNHDRRRFLLLLPGWLAAAWPASAVAGSARRGPHTHHAHAGHGPKHPEPRPNITAERVLTAEQLKDFPRAIPAFDKAREMPQIIDGIRCQCGCADIPGYYSLLSCFEGDAMARVCEVCKEEVEFIHKLYKEGKALQEIRAAFDAEFAW